MLILVVLCLAGCCTKEPSPPLKQAIPVAEEESLDDPEPSIDEIFEEEESSSTVRSFEQRWEDFRKRLKYSKGTDLIFYAEELYDEVPREDRKRRMELSFFLLEHYQKKGNRQKAKEYTQVYRKLLQATMGGVEFQNHAKEKTGSQWAGEKWEDAQEN